MCQSKGNKRLASQNAVFQSPVKIEIVLTIVFLCLLALLSVNSRGEGSLLKKIKKHLTRHKPLDVPSILRNTCRGIVAPKQPIQATTNMSSSLSKALLTMDIRAEPGEITIHKLEVKVTEDRSVFTFCLCGGPSELLRALRNPGRLLRSEQGTKSLRFPNLVEDISHCIIQQCSSNQWAVNNKHVHESGTLSFSVQSECLVHAKPISPSEWDEWDWLICPLLCCLCVAIFLLAKILQQLKAIQRNLVQLVENLNEIKDLV